VGGLAGAWLVAIGIVSWRESRQSGHMPVPAALLGVTGLFAALSLIGDISPRARPVVTVLGWGLDVAGLFQVLPGGLFGQVQKAQDTEASAEGEGGGTGTGRAPVTAV
jgi:hypothetical protein